MTTPTFEDLKVAFYEAAKPYGYVGHLTIDAGLRAVLDKLEPVVAEAYGAGLVKDPPMLHTIYAARLIAQLKGESRG